MDTRPGHTSKELDEAVDNKKATMVSFIARLVLTALVVACGLTILALPKNFVLPDKQSFSSVLYVLSVCSVVAPVLSFAQLCAEIQVKTS